MSQLTTKNKIIYIIIALIIIIGIIVIALKGFNVELSYRFNQKIELNIGKTIDERKIQNIANEVLGKNKNSVQIIEVYKDIVQITAKEITEEQKNSIVEKVNALYPQENSETKLINSSDIKIYTNSNVRLRDILKRYIFPISIATIIILIYFAIRYYKLGILRTILYPCIIIILAQLLTLSILAIIRFPMGRFTTPIILLVYACSLIYISMNIMKKQKELPNKNK